MATSQSVTIREANPYSIVFSESVDRSAPLALGTTDSLSDPPTYWGPVYVFVSPATGITSVRWIKGLGSEPVERTVSPYDVEGSVGGVPNVSDLTALDQDVQEWFALVETTDGRRYTCTARFVVSSTPTPDSIALSVGMDAPSISITGGASVSVSPASIGLAAVMPAPATPPPVVALDAALGVFRTGGSGSDKIAGYDAYCEWLDSAGPPYSPKPVHVLHSSSWKNTDWTGWRSAISANLSNYRNVGWATRGVVQLPYIPMCPQTHGGTLSSAVRSGEAGEFDSHWTWLGNTLKTHADSLAASGYDIYERLVLRPGTEHNGKWYPWTSNPQASGTKSWGSVPADSGRPAAFRAYWRRAYNLVMAPLIAAGYNVRWAWCVAQGGGTIVNAEAAYPTGTSAVTGRAYVDVITLDIYDESNYYATHGQTAATRAAVWEALESDTGVAAHGKLTLDWLASFADANTSGALGLDEWGVVQKVVAGIEQGGLDNPAFITNMHTWLSTQVTAGRLRWHCYFDQDASDGYHKLSPTRAYAFTNAAAEYLTRFGG